MAYEPTYQLIAVTAKVEHYGALESLPQARYRAQQWLYPEQRGLPIPIAVRVNTPEGYLILHRRG